MLNASASQTPRDRRNFRRIGLIAAVGVLSYLFATMFYASRYQ